MTFEEELRSIGLTLDYPPWRGASAIFVTARDYPLLFQYQKRGVAAGRRFYRAEHLGGLKLALR